MNNRKIFFTWYDWFLILLTAGIYIFIKGQKINHSIELLQKDFEHNFELLKEENKNIKNKIEELIKKHKQDVENLNEKSQNEINNQKKFYEQQIKNIEKQKEDRDKEIEKRDTKIKELEIKNERLSKDKNENIEKILKEKDNKLLEEKNKKISELETEKTRLKTEKNNLEKALNEEKDSKEKIIQDKDDMAKKLNQEIGKLNEKIKFEEENDINTQLINANPHDAGTKLADYVEKILEEHFGGLSQYVKWDKEVNVKTEKHENKRIDFTIIFYKKQPVNIASDLQENFRVVIECKNYNPKTNNENLADNKKKYFKQLIEYSRLFKARFAVLLTNLEFDLKMSNSAIQCINDWEKQLKVKEIFKKSSDADLFIVKPSFFDLFLKVLMFLNDSMSFNNKFKKVYKSIDMEMLWKFINFIKTELNDFMQIKKILEDISSKNTKIFSNSSAIKNKIENKVVPLINKFSNDLYSYTHDMEFSLPLEIKNIPQTIEIKKTEIKIENENTEKQTVLEENQKETLENKEEND